MHRLITLAAAFAALAPGAALAERVLDLQGRLGASAGHYANRFDITAVSGTDVETAQAKRNELVYGVLGGITGSFEGFYANTELEIQQVNNRDGGEKFKSSDVTLTLGKQFSTGWGPFMGLRHVRQGRNAFDDEVQRENGLFAGLGYSGLLIGERVVTSFGAAYVRSDIRSGEVKFNNADGVSLRATAAFIGTPHSVSLRYRYFSSNIRLQDAESLLLVNLDESFLTLSYQYTLPITSLPIASGF